MAKNLESQKFGKLTVIAKAPKTGSKTLWLCKCDCGTHKTIQASHLMSGHTKSCGCSGGVFKDLKGKKYGLLTVISRELNENNKVMWLCKCDCGQFCVVNSGNLNSGNSKSCGCVTRQSNSDRSKLRTGENSYNWKGGITSLRESINNSAKYKEWRLNVYTRDSFTCQYSGFSGVVLEAHHIKPFRVIMEENNITTLQEALECEELWDVSNGITLAKTFHSQTSKRKNAFHKKYGSRKSTMQDFKNWFMMIERGE